MQQENSRSFNQSTDESPTAELQTHLQAVAICRKHKDIELLNGVTLSIKGGDRLALVGPTGSGKTLLLRSLALLDSIDSGDILWQSDSVQGNRVPGFRRQVIYLHQRPTLFDGSVEENLKLPFSFQSNANRRFDREQIVESLRRLGRSESFLSKKESELSGGEMQLTALLRAIQLEPRILLLDEPTAALDSQSTERFESFVQTWLEESPDQRASVWVTHDPAQIARVATTTLKMEHGNLLNQSPS